MLGRFSSLSESSLGIKQGWKGWRNMGRMETAGNGPKKPQGMEKSRNFAAPLRPLRFPWARPGINHPRAHPTPSLADKSMETSVQLKLINPFPLWKPDCSILSNKGKLGLLECCGIPRLLHLRGGIKPPWMLGMTGLSVCFGGIQQLPSAPCPVQPGLEHFQAWGVMAFVQLLKGGKRNSFGLSAS